MSSEIKNRKPANTAFKQQRLKAWQPILTPKTVLPTLFIVGILFAPLGGLLLYASDNVSELVIDYTNCAGASDTYQYMPSNAFSAAFPGTSKIPVPQYRVETVPLGPNPNVTISRCYIKLDIPVTLKPPVFLYYKLTNFFQNHRRYVKSFDVNQLKGTPVDVATLENSNCKPLATTTDGTNPGNRIAIYPCGLIANSMFNDTISNFVLLNIPGGAQADNETYAFGAKGIAWASDAQKYKKSGYTDLTQIRPPPNWAVRYPNGMYTPEFPPPDISQDEHFQVWMRTAGLPNFRKLYGRNDSATMKEGKYEVVIDMNFDVKRYGGTKAIVISTVSFLGGRNPFLGIAYIAVGVACVVLGALFTARHLYKPRKLGDHTYLSWNQTAHANPAGGPNFSLTER
ncbi:alkylphosphocholine resistance protein lem3 [Basidiobolus ranarum]|uniref:Alkylphosphocholine resistance protein lem3 n=1 Tax=Basidiobolus ranarum TaxID=34480 RepID=A0ABR2WAA5_9FUNG